MVHNWRIVNNMDWRHRDSPSPRKFPTKHGSSFFNYEEVIFVDCLPPGHTIMIIIEEKRQGVLRSGFLFHQNNAPYHNSCVSMAAIHNFDFQILKQPRYSPDLLTISYLQNRTSLEINFVDKKDVATAVNEWTNRIILHRYSSILGPKSFSDQ